MIESGGFVEQERVVEGTEQVVVALERRDDHPVEGERSEHREGAHQCVESAAPQKLPRVHHTTSARRAIRSISAAIPARTGKRKREIAAPWARSPPSIPLKKVHVASTCV